MRINFKNILLILLFLFALFLRVYNLTDSPPGFNADEAALGYNAYSIIKTGKDEWGIPLPLVFKSFSDYKPGLYVYLALPFIYLFDLTELSTRLPSILLGSLSIVLIYYLSKRIFESEVIAFSTAFLLAISPWHIHYSRGAWETNVATFFMLVGMLAFLKGMKNFKYFILSAVSFILSMYTYQSTRLVVPFLLILLAISYFKFFFGSKKVVLKKELIISGVVGFVLLIPLMLTIFTNQGLARFQGISIFTDVGILTRINVARGEHSDPNSLAAKIYHNKVLSYSLTFTQNYFSHFSPDFLFIKGDPLQRNKVPEMGEMYFFEIITLLLGVFVLLTRNLKDSRVIFIWLLVAPVAASLTYQTPHALRSLNMVIPLTLISGAGLGMLIEFLWQRNIFIKTPAFVVMTAVILFFFSTFLHEYFVHLPKEYALEWEYGFSQLVPYVMQNKDSHNKVVVTTKYDQPYILFLFYSKYDPSLYQKTFKPSPIDEFGFSTIESFDNLEFRKLSKTDNYEKNNMYVGTSDEIPDGMSVDKTINFPNGSTAFKIVSIK